KQAYRDGLVDPGNISMDDVRHDFALGKRGVLARLADDRHHRMVRDTIKEMEWWACFQPEWKHEPDPPPPVSIANRARLVPVAPKIGRNDPCPCGSGKKYKKCCLGN